VAGDAAAYQLVVCVPVVVGFFMGSFFAVGDVAVLVVFVAQVLVDGEAVVGYGWGTSSLGSVVFKINNSSSTKRIDATKLGTLSPIFLYK
jgi:hypothetical protein